MGFSFLSIYTKNIRMYQDKYFRSWNGPFDFNLSKISSEVPAAAFGVYEILKKTGITYEVMYIGIATGASIRDRLRKHWSGIGNKKISNLGNTAEFSFVFWVC